MFWKCIPIITENTDFILSLYKKVYIFALLYDVRRQKERDKHMSAELLKALPSLANDSVAKQVTDILTDLIVTGKIKQGDYLPTEEDLCREFGIGRSSVREAIKTLESRGMVRKFHGKGVVVIEESAQATAKLLPIALKLKKTTMKDILEFRNSIEIKMTELAASRATEEQIKVISDNLEKMRNEEYKLETFAEYDYNFHKSVADASGNSIFSLMMETMRPMLYNHIIYTLNPEFNPENCNHFHETILNTIISKDPVAASEAMKSHLAGTKSVMDELERANITI